MRRSDREISDRALIDGLIRRSQVCRLALSDDGQPYVVPMNFGYDGTFLYFHSAPLGRKIDILQKNSLVAFEFDEVQGISAAELPCNWSTKYRSVVGTGTAEVLSTSEQRRHALQRIMQQYGADYVSFPEDALARVFVFRVRISELSGKAHD